MGKFDYLTHYLKYEAEDTVTLKFSEIEKIIGEELCPSAYKYSAYWRLSPRHMLPKAIDAAGYKVEQVSLKEQTVILKKSS